jgi:hypothetical protein
MRVDGVAGNICWGLADVTCRVIGCHLTQESRIHIAFDDVASNTCQALPRAHISDLTGLQVLFLDNNFLTFLPDLSRMKDLRELRAQGNRLQAGGYTRPLFSSP